MTIQEAVAEIIRTQTKDIFKNPDRFFACLRDYAPEYPKEVRFIRNNFDDKLMGLFIDETKKVSHRLRLIKDQLEDFCYSDEKIFFYLESFGIPLGWEQEILDLKADSPMQVPSFVQQSKKQHSVNANVTDISLSEDILKQWGFQDKNSIPDVLNIPSTYRSPFGTMYRIIKIDSEVFKDCTNLKSVNIPDTVTEIGESAFENCRVLEKINIPDSVTKIGSRAFANCKSLIDVNIPSSVSEIGNSVFGGCSSLVSVKIPNKVTKISEGLFGNCKSLTSVTVPNGVIEIGDKAFAGCVTLPNILIPKTVTKIGSRAFANCKILEIMIIPNSVKDIGLEAFGGCKQLQQFTLPTRFTIFKDDIDKQIDLTSKANSAFKNAKVGDYIKFGNYPQTSSGQNQPIEWQVLSKENNKMLVISRYGLDAKRFDSSSNNWSNSEIRKWLNGDFYNKAFTDQEKKSINLSNLSDVGTTDNVFFLSKQEAEKYFANDESRKCKATEYAVKNGAWVADSSYGDNAGYSVWWLRSPEPNFSNVVYIVDYGGRLGSYNYVYYVISLARPALSLNL